MTVATASADALYRQGLDAVKHADLALAITLLGQALALDRCADYAKALADAYLDAADYPRALGAYVDAIDLAHGHPEEFKLHANRGVCLEMLGRIDDALGAYLRALELNPRCEQAHANAQQIHLRRGNEERAAPHTAFLSKSRRDAALLLREALRLPAICSGAQEIAEVRRKLAENLNDIELNATGRIERPEIDINTTALYLSYHGEPDRALLEHVCRVVRKFYPAQTDRPAPKLRSRPRIGFVSPFFRNHSIGRYCSGVLRELSRERFEVFAFGIDTEPDETNRIIRRRADRYVALPGHIPAIVKAIREAELDVLFFPDIGLHPATAYLAYWRLAPVQCATWGHPDTTGLDTIDYFLSSKGCERAGSDTDYTEPLIKLDGFFMPAYERSGYTPAARNKADFGVGPADRVYLCGQTLFKVHPDFDGVVGAILRADPNGHVRFLVGPVPEWVDMLRARFRRCLPDVHGRIGFIPAPSTVEFLGLHRAADVVLDTFHFGGGISALDTFDAGVPMVTLPGPFFRGRQAAACYAEMDIGDCIASTPQEYVEIALRIAREPELRRDIDARITARSGRLFGRTDSVRALEEFLLQAVERQRDSSPSRGKSD
jgi:protein O-GlcNAc transferase